MVWRVAVDASSEEFTFWRGFYNLYDKIQQFIRYVIPFIERVQILNF